jgi:hypothetical protein
MNMSKITYHKNSRVSEVRVYSDGLRIGTIKMVPGGWQYFPKGSETGGKVFETVVEVKRSLSES